MLHLKITVVSKLFHKHSAITFASPSCLWTVKISSPTSFNDLASIALAVSHLCKGSLFVFHSVSLSL